MSRRASFVLLAAAVWTLYVWGSRLWIMAGQDESTGFKVVHGILALVSIAFGVAVGIIGWRAWRESRRTTGTPGTPGSPVEAAGSVDREPVTR